MNKEKAEKIVSEDNKVVNETSIFNILKREIRNNKWAFISFIFLVAFIVFVYASTFFINIDTATKVDLLAIKQPPSPKHWLGTDDGGRDVFANLVLGARNSFTIGILITFFSGLIGILIGVVSGFFGGKIDNIIMRVIDFVSIVPFMMVVIVVVSIVPNYTVWTFVWIMTFFTWMAKARLVRAKALSEREQEYISASKVLGTPNWKIILFELLPNISSIIIVNLILNLAGNIGVETSLSFLGFGLPASTPSLGTLISKASDPSIMSRALWIWMPAAILILLLMLSINNLGQAFRRSLDAQQRN